MNRKGIRFMFVVLSLFIFVSSAFAQAPKDVLAKKGMVSAANELASKAGVEILKKGGNAVDAAIATALALNVVEPNASGIGGGGLFHQRQRQLMRAHRQPFVVLRVAE